MSGASCSEYNYINDMVSSKCAHGADEFDDFCHIHQSANAKITGVVIQLSS